MFIVKIVPNEKGNPPGKLADVELHFNGDGPLAGLKLIGLRTSRKAIYAKVERAQLPGVRRIGRRVLIRRADLLHFLDHNCAPSPKENRR